MNCRRGDVILVLFPDSNLRTSKRRPALVVQADHLGAGLPQTIVAVITSNMARAGLASRLVVRIDSESAKGSGLQMDPVIMTDNLATVQQSEIDRILGALSELRELGAALRTTLALQPEPQPVPGNYRDRRVTGVIRFSTAGTLNFPGPARGLVTFQ